MQIAPLPQLIGSAPMLPGVVSVTGRGNTAPIILVVAKEKYGKSALATTLFGFPSPTQQPLIIAWDKSGPDSCIRLGYSPHAIHVADQPGDRAWTKARSILSLVETNRAAVHQQYGAIFVDCASTMAERLLEDARRYSPNPNPLAHYGELKAQTSEFMNRLVDVGLPTVWLAWLREPEIVEEKNVAGKKVKRSKEGGANISGSFRDTLSGKAHQILILDKQYVGVGSQGADSDGFLRVLHTRPWAGINANGRYQHLLPEPCPADLSYIIGVIRGDRAP